MGRNNEYYMEKKHFAQGMRTDPTVNQELINRNSCNHKPDGPDGVG